MDINKNVQAIFLLLTTFFLTSIKAVGVFQPTLEVTSCLQGKVSLTIRGGSDGGIVYIQGRGPACRNVTQDALSLVEFSFEECDIDWGNTFKVVIQKKSLYQTGEDKQIPVTCYPDTNDIEVGEDIRYSELYDEPGISRTTRPTATMLLLRNGENVGGQVIRLSDNVTMVIQLESNFEDDFDIEAKTCFADHLSITKDGCATDREMFPDFTHVRQGKLQASFRAFKPTNQQGGTITVSFRCILSVHLGNHTWEKCNEMQDGEARNRRAVLTDYEYFDDLNVTATVDIIEEDQTIQAMPQTSRELSCHCIRNGTFIGVTLILTACVIFSGAIIVWLKRKLKHEDIQGRRLTKDEVRHLVKLTSRKCSKPTTYKMDLDCTNTRPNNKLFE